MIGYVIITHDRPAKPDGFWFTIEKNAENVQIGSYIITEGDGQRIIGVVEDEEYYSVTDATSQYFSEIMASGGPSLPTYPIVIKIAKARIVAREPSLSVPPKSRWPVRFLNAKDAEVLHKNIPNDKRILAGFLTGSSEPVPVYYHANFLLGDQAAHMNIGGKTGLAAKTSYGVFIAQAVLSWAKKHGEPTAVVMFNVKRGDLMTLHKIPKNMKDAEEKIKSWAKKTGQPDKAEIYINLWNSAISTEEIDPFGIEVKYFTYPTDPYIKELDNAKYRYRLYRYGLNDITVHELLAALYSPHEEIPMTQVNHVYAYLETMKQMNRQVSFKEMYTHMHQYASYEPREVRDALSTRQPTPQQIVIRSRFNAPLLDNWHISVAGAIERRLGGFMDRARGAIDSTSPSCSPIKFTDIEPYKINVIQLYGLTDSEKRLVVNAVLREISDGLAVGESQIGAKRIMILIDELNAYAPKTKSPIKEQIIDITARGRDLQLSMIGIQQFASGIDTQVYGNCSTKVIGNSDIAEINSPLYKYLGEFSRIVPLLGKGELIIYHPMYASPMPVIFPVPLHEVM